MDSSKKQIHTDNPVRSANVISKLFFWYMFPLFWRSYKKGLTEDDIFEPLPEHRSEDLGNELENLWKKEFETHKKYALHIALFRIFGLRYFMLAFVRTVADCIIVVVIPISIGKVVSFFTKDQQTVSRNELYIYTGMIILASIIGSIAVHPALLSFMHLAMKIRVACSSLIYRKCLRLSRTSLSKVTVGHMVTLLSNDVNQFEQRTTTSHYVMIAPIQTAVGTYILYQNIGLSAFLGVGLLAAFIPIQTYCGNKTSEIRLRTALRTDERVRLMNEIISGIHVIKMYCWEKPFARLIAFARRKEMSSIRIFMSLMGFIMSFEMFITRSSVFVSILGYVLCGNNITAENVFSIAAIYSIIKPSFGTLFPVGIAANAQVNVTLHRLQEFLALDEQPTEVEELEYKPNSNMIRGNTVLNFTSSKLSMTPDLSSNKGRAKVFLKKVSAKWVKDSPQNDLENIDINISSGKLLALIGPVGSGKSSILNIFLKELMITEGEMDIIGKISYASQDPWLFAGSVRQNILFGENYDRYRYEKVVKVCALKSDFEMFPYGDKSLVGERGCSLSGGQRARINLARCIYKESDIYLLDDPLSAVDTNVGKHLYKECIRNFLCDKICILVTHQIQYLKNADHIIILNNGKIEDRGSYMELQSSGLDFAKLLEKAQDEQEEEKEKTARKRLSSMMGSVSEFGDDEPEIEEEVLTKGSIDISVYSRYIKAGGGFFSICFLLLLLLGGFIISYGGDYFIRYWVNLEQDQNTNVSSNSRFSRTNIIYAYSGIIASTVLIGVGQALYFMTFFAKASVNLHDMIFEKLIRSTVRFFDNNPSGRILNRFSKDLNVVDEYLPSIIYDVLMAVFILMGALILSVMVEPKLALPSVVILIAFYMFRKLFMGTSRSLKRIEGISRSPVYSHMTSSMQGLTTIRALSAQKMLIEEFDIYQDRHSRAWYLFLVSGRTMGSWVDVMCITFIAVAIYTILIISPNIHGGDIGLIITQYIGLVGSLQYGMRQWCELENQMTSVERVLEYTEIETEPKRAKLKNLSKTWPENGKIEFRNVYLRYQLSDPYVLQDLSFTVESKQKIGIVGRTGAGKSSTITALFQLYALEGSILVDDIDITKMPLNEARAQISIIPQEPVLFSGTMRKNLDPFEQYDDGVLWNALEQVELKSTISALEYGLNSQVSEGGSNFSIGQKQLVCLARALIRNNKILVLDEATANVDPHTDALIQNTIRNKFSECTVLTIAHRLHTVMDSDKILVMNNGKVEEFDHPHVLLKDKRGILRSLVNGTDKSSSITLEKIASESYNSKTK